MDNHIAKEYDEKIKSFFENISWNNDANTLDLLKVFDQYCFYATEFEKTNDLINRKIVEFSKVFVAGTYDDFNDFKLKLESYDFSVVCGYTWTDSSFGYRCRTCCLSLDAVYCVACFNNGHHIGHDTTKFRCSNGALCDCGNADALKESGFCCNHGPKNVEQPSELPDTLVRRLRLLIPIYIKRFVAGGWKLVANIMKDDALRIQSDGTKYSSCAVLSTLGFINELISCGWLPQKLMADAFIDKDLFKEFMKEFRDSEEYLLYDSLVESELDLSFPEDKLGPQKLQHETMLDVIMLLGLKLRFHESIVTLLNGMLRIDAYKEDFIQSFLNHHPLIVSSVLTQSRANEFFTNRGEANGVSVMAVQVFSFEVNVLKQVKCRNYHSLMVHCLLNVYKKTLVELESYGINVVDMRHYIIQTCHIWPFISNFIGLGFHKAVVDILTADQQFMNDWVTILKWMQFMSSFEEKDDSAKINVTQISIGSEIEVSVSPMWNFWSNNRAEEDKGNVVRLVSFFVKALSDFIRSLKAPESRWVTEEIRKPMSFHLPLMRNTTGYLSLALFHHHLPLSDLLSNITNDEIARWFAETSNTLLGCWEVSVGYWRMNQSGADQSGQDYRQCKHCFGFIDMDILASQICASVLPSSTVVYTLTDSTQLLRGIHFSHSATLFDPDSVLMSSDMEKQSMALEAWMMNLCWLLDLRTELATDDEVKLKREVCSQLCFGPLKRSYLDENLRRRTNMDNIQNTTVDSILSEIAIYVEPTFDEYSKNLQNGFYTFKPQLWDTLYDPVYQALRSASQRDARQALSRYREYHRKQGSVTYSDRLWPPYKQPQSYPGELSRLEGLLHSRDLAYIVFCSLLMFQQNDPRVTEDTLALIVHLIRRSLLTDEPPRIPDENVEAHKIRYPDNPFPVNNMRINIIYNVEIHSEGGITNEENKRISPKMVYLESIVSLLMKLHSKLHTMRSGRSALFSHEINPIRLNQVDSSESSAMVQDQINEDSRSPRQRYASKMSLNFYNTYPLVYRYSSSNIVRARETGLGINYGDGVDFIGHVLDLIVSMNDDTAQYVFELIEHIMRADPDDLSSDCDSLQLTDDFSDSQSNSSAKENKKKQTVKDRRQKMMIRMALKQKNFATVYNIDGTDESGQDAGGARYECVICQLNSEETNIEMALLGLVCSTDLLLYMADEPQWSGSDSAVTHRKDYRRLSSIDIPVLSTGIIIQTCGHVVHTICFDKYRRSKHYSTILTCPMCRRDVHYVIPFNIPDQHNIQTKESFYSILQVQLLKSLQAQSEDIIYSLYGSATLYSRLIKKEQQACVLLRSQLELELIMCLSAPDQYSTVTKRCHWPEFISYLRTLNANIITLIKQSDWLLGTSIYEAVPIGNKDTNLVVHPFIFESPTDIFLNFIPHIWPFEDQIQCILEACIVMAYVKGMVMIGSKLGRSDYDQYCKMYSDTDNLAVMVLKRCETIYGPMEEDWSPMSAGILDIVTIDLVKCLLPLLRLAAVIKLRLLKTHEIPKNFPIVAIDKNENPDYFQQFIRLCEYLNLIQSNSSPKPSSELLIDLISKCLKSTLFDNVNDIVKRYIDDEFIAFFMKENINGRSNNATLSILGVGNELKPPHLIDLPRVYEDLFNAYYNRACIEYDEDLHINTPLRNGICLICGGVLCFVCLSIPRSCKMHSKTCCVGTGLVIDISTSIIYVIDHEEICQWGSVYLDSYGEEDLELKRGRPLFINARRLKLLEQQWLTLSFKHVLKAWEKIY